MNDVTNGVMIHPKALVETKDIGEGTRVWAFAHVMAGAKIGKDCNIGDHCFVETGAVIGDQCTIKNGTMIWEGVTLDEGVFVGPNVLFTNDLVPRSPRLADVRERYAEKKNWLAPTKVERGAAIGAGAVILAGITIGEFAMVAAGAVVTKSVPAHRMVIGFRARESGFVCRCGHALRIHVKPAICGNCKARYVTTKEGIRASGPRKS
jgi:UDP-2-acetamido-3-amino-2,3-dideoxy-glucuronate N-acetyltransferase